MADLWTAEDVELVEAALQDAPWPCEHGNIQGDRHTCGACLATAVLAALAEAGRLPPADAREEWGVRHLRDLIDGPLPEPQARDFAKRSAPHGRLVRRWVGPWLPVPAPNLLPATPNLAATPGLPVQPEPAPKEKP